MERAALISGAARGIGLETAVFLLEERGYRVIVLDIDAAEGESARRSLSARFGRERVLFLAADVSLEDDVRRAADFAAEQFGTISLLVNNAAIRASANPMELTLSAWNRVLAVNLTGPFLMSRAFAPLLAESAGSIVNICSTRALMSEAGTEAYSASKGGLLSMTHALAMSLGPMVRVNAVSPGWINSAGAILSTADNLQHPAGRVGTCRDVAAMVAWLASDEAGFVTGQNFIVDGGMTRKMIYVE
jgi:NAD(P)-dependent dehydrogenase (short-subunit alcohol dehydrogenase family)